MTLGLVYWIGVHPAAAQITNVVFSDDFENGVFDPSVYQPDAPFFEGGVGNISATEASGVVEFTGTVSQQWWAGGTLRLVRGFSVSDETNLVVSVDRVSETGQGTASRSALWIMDSTTNNFVLFADVRAEGGWRHNRKIGEAGDVPTGSGTDMPSLNIFEDGALHRMKVIADGKNVRLYVDDVFGAQVKFPFKDLIIQFGSYARANNDTAHTIFDNLRIETVGKAAFSQTKLALTIGQSSSAVSVRIPLGANATTPVILRVTSSVPAAVNAVGAVGDTLTLVFAAGGSNTKTLDLQAIGGSGGARFTLANDIGLEIANFLDVVVIEGPGVRLQDNFASGLDPAKWEILVEGYEGGAGFYDVLFSGGRVEIVGDTQIPLWGGGVLKTVDSFVATEDLTLSVEVDRVNMDITQGAQPPVAARTGILLTTSDGLDSVFFSQSLGESGWQVNLKPGINNIPIPAFASVTDTGNHRMKVVANGEVAQVYLDGRLGGSFPFPVSSGIFVKIGAFGREAGDSVSGQFDNVLIANTLPCVTSSASDLSVVVGQSGSTVTVTIPRLLTANGAASVTVTSADPSVAVPTGATGGSLTLNFAAGGSLLRTFDVTGVGIGQTTLSFSSAGVCVPNNIEVTVTTVPAVLLSDDFSAAEYDISKWVLDSTPLGAGTATPQSAITLENGNAKIVVIGESGTGWPGLALATVDSYAAELTSPVSFEIDRVQLGFTLVTGTSAKQRTGIWITDATRTSYVFFSEYGTHDGAIGGWQYHRSIGQPGDNPVTDNDTIGGVLMPAFAEAGFNNRGNHRMKAVANGTTVRLYVDNVLGAEVPFPFADGIGFRFGAYVRAGTDIVTGRFDNARVLGRSPVGALSISRAANGGVTISWDGPGVLQSTGVLGDPNAWSDVNPAPAGNSLTVSAAQQGTARFYRLRLP